MTQIKVEISNSALADFNPDDYRSNDTRSGKFAKNVSDQAIIKWWVTEQLKAAGMPSHGSIRIDHNYKDDSITYTWESDEENLIEHKH